MAGMKPKLTKQLIEKAADYKAHGLSNKDIIAALGISTATFYAWLQTEHEDGTPIEKTALEIELSEQLKKAEAGFKQSLLENIEQQGREKDWKAHAWLLERIYPAEFSRVDRVQAEVNQNTTSSVAVTHYFDYGEEEEGGAEE